MLRFCLLPALVFSVLFSASVHLVNARPYTNAALVNFLAAPTTCVTPCWFGIRPGITGLSTLKNQLEGHDWIGEISFTATTDPDSGFVVWDWRDAPAGLIDTSRQGTAGVHEGLVTWLQIPTMFAFGDIWLTNGPPISGLTIAIRRPARFVRHYAAYDSDLIQVRYTIPCAWSPADRWQTRVDLWLGMGSPVPMPAYHRPARHDCQVR